MRSPRDEGTVYGERRSGARLDATKRLREILDTFARTPGIRGAALADRKGLPIASSFRSRANVNVASAMAALAVQTGAVKGVQHRYDLVGWDPRFWRTVSTMSWKLFLIQLRTSRATSPFQVASHHHVDDYD